MDVRLWNYNLTYQVRRISLKEPLIKSRAVATTAFRDGIREARRSQWPSPLASRATKQTARKGAPDSVSRSVVREGAQAAARNIVKWGAHVAAPAPQASLTVSRQPSLWVAAKCGVCIVLAEAWSLGTCDREGERWPAQPQSGELTARFAAQLRRCDATRALLSFVVHATTFVARLASIRILPATQSAEDLIRGSLCAEQLKVLRCAPFHARSRFPPWY